MGKGNEINFNFTLYIDAEPDLVFTFFRDKHLHSQEQGSSVLLIEKVTPEPVSLGTRFREVVQVFPWYQMEIWSEVSMYEHGTRIAEHFWGPAIRGDLEYQLSSHGSGTKLVQIQSFDLDWVIKLLQPFIRPVLSYQLRKRLKGIKRYLEKRPINP